jgi:hypothetical protein
VELHLVQGNVVHKNAQVSCCRMHASELVLREVVWHAHSCIRLVAA